MNTVTTDALTQVSQNPVPATAHDSITGGGAAYAHGLDPTEDEYMGTPVYGIYGLGGPRTSRRAEGFGGIRTSRRAEGFGDVQQILGMPWYLAAGLGLAAIFVLPKLLK